MRIPALTVLAALSLAACATSSEEKTVMTPEEDPRVVGREDGVCFTRTINGFSEWDAGEGVILNRSVNDRYLVTFVGPCFPLDTAIVVGLSPRFGTGGCLRRGDLIYFSDSVSGRSSTPFQSGTCRVGDIYRFDPKAKADDTDEASDEAGEEG
ncbi:DUF6491 family protein [Parvularcula lutaonensis]|uniref:DUF6491 family protein n=1 Tax=Parvularcula lutaonensis TaxID=491923 RepID=A0ABV7M8G1_9PROT|nr:DUF6491 family protein [Parvularcula lutaonensis]GGY44274.1 hypothetical protein GCM10007148_11460 [Parvularcula lutaonensis]